MTLPAKAIAAVMIYEQRRAFHPGIHTGRPSRASADAAKVHKYGHFTRLRRAQRGSPLGPLRAPQARKISVLPSHNTFWRILRIPQDQKLKFQYFGIFCSIRTCPGWPLSAAPRASFRGKPAGKYAKTRKTYVGKVPVEPCRKSRENKMRGDR